MPDDHPSNTPLDLETLRLFAEMNERLWWDYVKALFHAVTSGSMPLQALYEHGRGLPRTPRALIVRMLNNLDSAYAHRIAIEYDVQQNKEVVDAVCTSHERAAFADEIDPDDTWRDKHFINISKHDSHRDPAG